MMAGNLKKNFRQNWNGTSWIDFPFALFFFFKWSGLAVWHEESNLATAWEIARWPQRRLIDEGSFVHIEVDMMLGGRFSSWWSLKASQWLERLQWVCHGLPQPIYGSG